MGGCCAPGALAGLVLLTRRAGARHDLLDDGGLGVCVMLHVPPGTLGQVALDLQVGVAVCVIGAIGGGDGSWEDA